MFQKSSDMESAGRLCRLLLGYGIREKTIDLTICNLVKMQIFYLVLFTFLGNKNFPLYLQSFRISGTLHEDCMGVLTLIQCPSLSYVFFS